jgi:hypothetical protein
MQEQQFQETLAQLNRQQHQPGGGQIYMPPSGMAGVPLSRYFILFKSVLKPCRNTSLLLSVLHTILVPVSLPSKRRTCRREGPRMCAAATAANGCWSLLARTSFSVRIVSVSTIAPWRHKVNLLRDKIAGRPCHRGMVDLTSTKFLLL